MMAPTRWDTFMAALLLAITVPLANPQSCARLTDPTCSLLIPVGTQIYVPPGYDLKTLETYSNRLINLLNFVGFVKEPCRSYVLQALCASWLRPCHVEGLLTLPVPEQPCVEVCVNQYNACAAGQLSLGIQPGTSLFFPDGYGPPLNCSVPPIDTSAGSTLFYQSHSVKQIIPYNGVNYLVPCSQNSTIDVPAPSYCNPPLVTSGNEIRNNVCAFSCPLPSLTERQYDSAKIMQGILGWMSWVTSAILILALLVNPKTRSFPRNLVIMTAAAANVAAGAIILPTYAGYDNTWCGGSDVTYIPPVELVNFDPFGVPDIEFSVEETSLSFESSLCTFQGAMLQFGFLAAVFWWTIIAFNMCLELFLGRVSNLENPKWKWSRFGLYVAVGWGVPFVLMVIPASAGKIKFAPGGTYCFISAEDNNAWSLIFWFLPVGICMLVGFVLFIAALIRITILLVTLKKLKELMFLYFRLFIFILLYLILFIFIFAYNIQYAKNKTDIEEGYSAYYKCLIYGASKDCSLSDSVTMYGLVMLKAWAISSLGVLLFFIFLSWDVLRYWLELFKAIGLLIVRRKKTDAIGVVNKFIFPSTHTRSRTVGSNSLTVTQIAGGDDEGDEMEDAVEAEESGVDNSSSSSTANEEENGLT